MDDITFEEIGGPVAAIDTPALLIDHDVLQRNIQRMAEFGHTAGIDIRPHAKTHKTPVIAHMQVAAGAVGQCAQKVGEAEILVTGGVKDVLVANEVVGPTKLHRLATLARQARITVAVDHPDAASALAEAAHHHRVSVGAVVDVDVGLGRCGVLPADAVELGKHVGQLRGIELRGLYYRAITAESSMFMALANAPRRRGSPPLDSRSLLMPFGKPACQQI